MCLELFTFTIIQLHNTNKSRICLTSLLMSQQNRLKCAVVSPPGFNCKYIKDGVEYIYLFKAFSHYEKVISDIQTFLKGTADWFTADGNTCGLSSQCCTAVFLWLIYLQSSHASCYIFVLFSSEHDRSHYVDTLNGALMILCSHTTTVWNEQPYG